MRRLADGGFHSGEALAATLGLSRARVSQVLRDAETAGFRLERIRGRGYRLLDPQPFLDRAAILAAIAALAPSPAPAMTVDVADTVDSTSSELARRSSRSDIHRKLLAAEWQSAGRGRRGRGWTAVAGGSLTFSLGWRFEQGAGFLGGLSLAIGVALARALEAQGFADILLKWPNDLMHRHCKFGGILVELSGDALGPSLVIIGVGLNVRLPQRARRDIAQAVTDLASIAGAKAIDRNALLARIIVELVAVLERYAAEGFAPLRAEWQRRHVYQRKPVQMLLPDRSTVRGEVVGIDADGALVLDSGGQRMRFVTGEVSLRRT